MGTPNANVSRENFDASKGYSEVTLQQGVPIPDADWNELQRVISWNTSRSRDVAMAFDTSQVTVAAGLYDLVQLVDLSKTWPADAPTVADTLVSWFPGSMRPWIAAGDSKANDFNIQWGPAWIQGLFIDDTDQRGPTALYSDTSHIITAGTLTGRSGTTVTDNSKIFNGFTAGSLHLVALSGGVGNGQDARCEIVFTSGAENGNTYSINATPGSDQLTILGVWGAGGPAIGDTYYIKPNDIIFGLGVTYNVWLCVMVEDIDTEEDPDVQDPIMSIECMHKLKTRYWMRVLRDGITMPTAGSRPDYGDAAPQIHKNRVYWEKVAVIVPTVAATLSGPAEISYSTPGHYEIASFVNSYQLMTDFTEIGGDKQRLRMQMDLGALTTGHRFLFEGIDEDSAGQMSYILDLQTPDTPTGYAGLRIGGPSTPAAIWNDGVENLGFLALHILDGGFAIGDVISPVFHYSTISNSLYVMGDFVLDTTLADDKLEFGIRSDLNDAIRAIYNKEDIGWQKYFDLDFGPGDDTGEQIATFDFSAGSGNRQAIFLFDSAAIEARSTLTFPQNPADTETVTINAKTYTFQAVLTNVDGNVLIGATASDSLDNLIAAIDLGAGSGTLYAAATTDPSDVDASTGSGDTLDVEAEAAGVAGNAMASTTTVTSAFWTAGTLQFGSDNTGTREVLVQDGNFRIYDNANGNDFALFDMPNGKFELSNPANGNSMLELAVGGNFVLNLEEAGGFGFQIKDLSLGSPNIMQVLPNYFELDNAVAAAVMIRMTNVAQGFIDCAGASSTGKFEIRNGNLAVDNVEMEHLSPGTLRHWSIDGYGLYPYAYAEDSGNVSRNGDEFVYDGTGILQFELPLHLPEGVNITDMLFESKLEVSGASNELFLMERDFTTGAVTSTTKMSSSNVINDGNYKHTTAPVPTAFKYDPANYKYNLRVKLSASGVASQCKVRGVKVLYRSNKLYDDGLGF